MIRTVSILTLLGVGLLCPEIALGQAETLFRPVPASHSGIQHWNTVVETPELFLWHFDYFYTGSGVAVGDLNNDGLPDLVFGGNHAPNSVYINQGDLRFKSISESCGIQAKKRWTNGVNLIDINHDGWLDIYCNNGGPGSDTLVFANQLFINQGVDESGQIHFIDQAEQYGLAGHSRSVHANFFDFDKDGDLDVFVNNHSHPEILRPKRNRLLKDSIATVEQPVSSRLYRNEGNGYFVDITVKAGLLRTYFGLGSTVSDFDQDGWLDLYVSNDYDIPDYFWRNNGDGTFSEVIKKRMGHVSWFGMGCDAADLNNDGLEDILVADMTPSDHVRNKTLMAPMHPARIHRMVNEKKYIPQYMFNTLQVNMGGGYFSEAALMCGFAQTDWTWSVLMADFDLDGYKDVFFSTGFLKDIRDNDWRQSISKMVKKKDGKVTAEDIFNWQQQTHSEPTPNRIYQNLGELKFKARTQDWGLGQASFTNGAAYADLDQDGDLDLILNHLNDVAEVYENHARDKSTGANYIRFALLDQEGGATTLNAKVNIFYQDQQQVIENKWVRGYESQMEPVVHFGLGDVTQIDRVEVNWPDGTVSTIQGPEINTTHQIEKEKSGRGVKTNSDQPTPIFKSFLSGVPYHHFENQFYDFGKERLLPHRQSRQGPALATGDLNGDGLDDFYVGGARAQMGAVYLQGEYNQFYELEQAAFVGSAGYEDQGASLVDIDGDGDLDLYVASGGDGSYPENTHWMQDRLYWNDGQGNLTEDKTALPPMYSCTQSISFCDWDGDGDLDIFVGGRNIPNRYPFAPPSYLLENKGGQFVQVDSTLIPDLSKLGLVTAAEWSDIDQNGWPDLLVVGEWMPLTIFFNDGGEFTKMQLPDSEGWWYSLVKADFDGDGDEDFIAGNLGLNNKFHPSPEKPLHIYTNDFDENGSYDIVLSKYYQGQKVPVRGRQCSAEQMPNLRAKFPSYRAFAEASLEEIYSPDKLDQALHLEARTMAHLYLENDNGQLTMRPLPRMAQIAPINAMVLADVDGDGREDVIAAGNNLNTEVETPRYDAGKGMVLLNRPEGFEVRYHLHETGLLLRRDLRQLAKVKLTDGWGIIGANNNGLLQFYKHNLMH